MIDLTTANHQELLAEIERLRAEIDELEVTLEDEEASHQKTLNQLPEGMRKCTILFKKCPLGHGWLTATNWVQHGCPTCAIEEERKKCNPMNPDGTGIPPDPGATQALYAHLLSRYPSANLQAELDRREEAKRNARKVMVVCPNWQKGRTCEDHYCQICGGKGEYLALRVAK